MAGIVRERKVGGRIVVSAERRTAEAVRLRVVDSGGEVGHAYLYLLRNDLHQRPFGYMEDVLVAEERRGQGIGTRLVQAVIAEARRQGCYKLIGCSRYARPAVHRLYLRLGFADHGKEFRLDL